MKNENEFFNRFEKLFTYIEQIAQYVRKTVEEKQEQEQERLLSRAEAADFLGVSERTIDRYRDRRVIEYSMIGGQVRISKEALWDVLRSNTIKKSPKTRDEFEANFRKYMTDKKKSLWKK